MRTLSTFALITAAVIAMTAAVAPKTAHADARVAALAKTVATSSSVKARLAAVTSLARLNDKAALRPLVDALSDPHPPVRAIAIAGLARLGHKAALPALTTTANDDTDLSVRAKAKQAASAIAKANKLPDPWPVDVKVAAAAPSRRSGGKAGFGNQPRALAPQAEVFLMVSSSTDDSPGKQDQKTRDTNASVVKTSLLASVSSNVAITVNAADAAKLGLPTRHVDLSVTRMELTMKGEFVVLDAQLRIAVSDDKGKMLSFISGAAKVEVPKQSYKPKYLSTMRRDVLEGAMTGILDKLLSQLKAPSNS